MVAKYKKVYLISTTSIQIYVQVFTRKENPNQVDSETPGHMCSPTLQNYKHFPGNKATDFVVLSQIIYKHHC